VAADGAGERAASLWHEEERDAYGQLGGAASSSSSTSSAGIVISLTS
jgi:hypothetical protein